MEWGAWIPGFSAKGVGARHQCSFPVLGRNGIRVRVGCLGSRTRGFFFYFGVENGAEWLKSGLGGETRVPDAWVFSPVLEK